MGTDSLTRSVCRIAFPEKNTELETSAFSHTLFLPQLPVRLRYPLEGLLQFTHLILNEDLRIPQRIIDL